MKRSQERGQVLVLFAGGLIGLLALCALAIGVSSVYSTQQTEKAASDAASLAGAQDLQVPGSRSLGGTPGEIAARRAVARGHALEDVAGRFGVPVPTGAGCSTAADISDCVLTGTPYHAAISTPSKTTGDPRSLQVSVTNPQFQLPFGGLFAQNGWNVGRTSVAVTDNARSYALMTLRPPMSGSVSDVKDIAINGGTHVVIGKGDVGSNANMYYDGTCGPGGSVLLLDAGYNMYYYDPFNPPAWCSGNPTGIKIPALIQDPLYTIPSELSPLPPHDPSNYSAAECHAIATAITDPFYASMVTAAGSDIVCLRKGQYTSDPFQGGGPGPALAILEPGLYFFDAGLTLKGTLIGGYTADSPGVALVFHEGQDQFHGNAGTKVYLNAGAKLDATPGAQAKAAIDFAGLPVQTNTTPAVLLTLMVQPDLNCEGPGRTVVFPIPGACAMPEQKRSAVQLTGTASLYLAGVQYGPTDNMSLNASSANGYVGQIVAWTVKYSGGTTINQEGLVQPLNGVLRLDKACSGGDTPCTP